MLDKKKIFFGVLIIILSVGIGLGVYLWTKPPLKKQPAGKLDYGDQVLSSLEKEYEFCQIVKEDGAEFWLICNGRPFYAAYEDGKVSYELNGWGFLREQPKILKELQDNHCHLYQTTDDHILSFVCEEDETVRKYTFSTPDFKLTKQSEELFLNEVFHDLWRSQVFPCEVTDARRVDWENEPLIELTINCQNYKTRVFFNFDKLSFTLPLVVDESLTDEEKIQQSINILDPYFCNLESTKKLTEDRRFVANFDCPKTGQLKVDCNLSMNMASFLINKDEFEDFFFFTGGKIFPWLVDKEVKYLSSSQDEVYQYHYYLVGNQVVVAQAPKESSLISEVYLKDENIKQ